MLYHFIRTMYRFSSQNLQSIVQKLNILPWKPAILHYNVSFLVYMILLTSKFKDSKSSEWIRTSQSLLSAIRTVKWSQLYMKHVFLSGTSRRERNWSDNWWVIRSTSTSPSTRLTGTSCAPALRKLSPCGLWNSATLALSATKSKCATTLISP